MKGYIVAVIVCLLAPSFAAQHERYAVSLHERGAKGLAVQERPVAFNCVSILYSGRRISLSLRREDLMMGEDI